jgi:6-pyruvoyltetrahydropterin/6-carboxytetrahydropterin synthase
MNVRLTKIELFKNPMNFSSGHFTIFSQTQRENLHGHNFSVHAIIESQINEKLGMTFDYQVYKKVIKQLCDSLDETILLPTLSPYLAIEQDKQYVYAHFNGEKLCFLHRDVKLMPLHNITSEELSYWFLNSLLDEYVLPEHAVESIEIKISTSPGQSASSFWSKS